jgi:hypothetical protein
MNQKSGYHPKESTVPVTGKPVYTVYCTRLGLTAGFSVGTAPICHINIIQ